MVGVPSDENCNPALAAAAVRAAARAAGGRGGGGCAGGSAIAAPAPARRGAARALVDGRRRGGRVVRRVLCRVRRPRRLTALRPPSSSARVPSGPRAARAALDLT